MKRNISGREGASAGKEKTSLAKGQPRNIDQEEATTGEEDDYILGRG